MKVFSCAKFVAFNILTTVESILAKNSNGKLTCFKLEQLLKELFVGLTV